MMYVIIGLVGGAFTVWHLYNYVTNGYQYEYTFNGKNAIYKYSYEVFYKGKSIYHGAYHSTSMFGRTKMVVEALSHNRRKDM